MSADPNDGRPMTNDSSPNADDSSSADPADEETPASDPPDDIEALTGEVEALRDEVEGLKEERDELNERLLRKAAELENVRRRMDREKKRRHVAGKETVLESMLEVLDDFERSLDAAQDLDVSDDPESAYETLKGGVEMVYRKFQDQLQSLGVEPIEAEGQPFDEQLHEAMMRQPSDDVEPGNVLQEVQKGYTMGDRVLRHSRVVVAAEPSESSSAANSA
ncbi:nucleotide exchange factor GrpE [Salinibacter grassmerensis]|uniref:nucleotide exchange factor GrpE n=1 Tax=Salinibacter grassmerensis TaxID=3040353 RepID=UPI0021E7E42D|nr:nucleotide exchange factor GrpE [Salinibacter grassmerensis]